MYVCSMLGVGVLSACHSFKKAQAAVLHAAWKLRTEGKEVNPDLMMDELLVDVK